MQEKPHRAIVPTLLYINNAHYAATGSVGAKGKPTALQAPINKVQVVILWQQAV